MKAVLLKSFGDLRNSLVTESIPTPRLKPGQLLVKIAAASINPSDLVFLRNQYGIQKPLPVVPGLEGSGTVVAASRGMLSSFWMGRRVACKAPEDGNGTWAEYMACSADSCVPLKKGVTLEEGSSLIVNPLTAWSLLSLAIKEGHRAFIQTAAASALGKMMARLAKSRGLAAIHVVRRDEQVTALRSLGADHVLNSTAPHFLSQLTRIARELEATIAFDSVGGELSGALVQAMPQGGRLVVYGALAGEAVQVSPADLIFKGKTVGGFWLTQWIKHMSLPAKLQMVYAVQSCLKDDLKTEIRQRYPLEKVLDAIEDYKSNRSEGKVLLIPT